MLSPRDVTAVIVTRGDVDLQPVLDSLIFDKVVIWNNSIRRNEMTYGRVCAALMAHTSVVYSQDDDILHTRDAQQALVRSYEPGSMVGCMWPEWSDGARRQGIENGYDDLVFPGSGSVTDIVVWTRAIDAYLGHYQRDDFFRLWSDTLIGTIAPTRQMDMRFSPLPWAEGPTRMAEMPDGVALKTEAIRRGRAVRETLAVAA